MKIKTPPTASRGTFIFAAAILLLVLGLLFWRSFLPGIVHFSNDGPLGMQNARCLQMPEASTGIWYDLNSISSPQCRVIYPWHCPDLSGWVLGAVGYAKFLAPIALWILGVGAWFFFRQLKFSPLAAVLGGLAAAMNSTFFSTACWGVAAQQIAIGMDFFALGLVVSNVEGTPVLTRWSGAWRWRDFAWAST